MITASDRPLWVGSGLSGYRRIFNLPSCYAGLNGRVWPEPVVQGLLATVELTRINRPASKHRTAALGQVHLATHWISPRQPEMLNRTARFGENRLCDSLLGRITTRGYATACVTFLAP